MEVLRGKDSGEKEKTNTEEGVKNSINSKNIWKKFLGKKDNLILLILAGILLMIIAIPSGNVKSTWGHKEDISSQAFWQNTPISNEASQGGGEVMLESFEGCGIEHRLEALLEEIDGCSNVSVMITFTEEESGGSSWNGSHYDYCYSYPAIEGVVAVFEGADCPEIREQITFIIQALFPIEVHKIKVVNRKNE